MLPTRTCGVVAAAQVDTVLSRLIALKERIEGTEALIEIDLDHRRNELVAFDLVRQLKACTQPLPTSALSDHPFQGFTVADVTLILYSITCMHV